MGNLCTLQAARLALSAVTFLATFAGQAATQGIVAPSPAASAPRTVTWYADNPRFRAGVQLACLDDPGRLANTPDCINADRANVEVALREARSRTGTMDPRNTAFWSNDPKNRRSQLVMCRLNPQLDYCDVARRSLLIEAGQLNK